MLCPRLRCCLYTFQFVLSPKKENSFSLYIRMVSKQDFFLFHAALHKASKDELILHQKAKWPTLFYYHTDSCAAQRDCYQTFDTTSRTHAVRQFKCLLNFISNNKLTTLRCIRTVGRVHAILFILVSSLFFILKCKFIPVFHSCIISGRPRDISWQT